ncbi:helicase associated domain-containing protein [Gammaproteobacteria bacterium]|nr:helicase associated domain-containing protein [Gammaproteobacteria bacterium]
MRGYVNDQNFKLGNWVNDQRNNKELNPNKVKRLDRLGFVWDPIEQQWEQSFQALCEYKTKNGHCMVPAKYKTPKGTPLGSWVSNTRAIKDEVSTRNVVLTKERIKRLDDIGFVWEPHEFKWEQGFKALEEFYKQNGHCLAMRGYVNDQNFKLGNWVNDQRNNKELNPNKVKRLDRLGFVWDPIEQQWEQSFQALCEYKTKNGHCMVPAKYKTPEGISLGVWVQTLRRSKNNMLQEKFQKLDALGFSWKGR